MADLWAAPTTPPVFNVGTVLLLTDGTLLAQDDFTINWWRLRPDSTGDYANGTWTRAASAGHARRYFASVVLADGRVFVAGGKTPETRTTVDLLAAEIYDPVLDRWDELPVPAGWTAIGNAPCCVLPDSTVLLGNVDSGACAIYDPDVNAWRSTGRKLNGSAREESWTLLPDGSVLTVNCLGNLNSERYLAGAWRDEGSLPNALVPALSAPIGPAVLLPNGSVFATGATGATNIFTPNPSPEVLGAWTAGPALPLINGQSLSAADGPACLLPDGSVLFVAAITGGPTSKYLGGRSVLLKYDGVAVTELAVQPVTADVPPQWTRLLLLPNGQVLFASSRSQLRFLTPAGAPNQAWAPTILQTPRQLIAGQSYVLRGRQLTGMSQACVFGDDAGMATNYPLIRLRQRLGQTASVTYCRTWGHSTMGVATGDAEQITSFSVPTEIRPGAYLLEVVANGIASESVAVMVTTKGAPEAETQTSIYSKRETANNLSVQQEMFWRDLNEVHLLMDFISGRNDKSLLDLKDIPDLTPGAKGSLPPQEVVHRICLIRFPPIGSPDDKADQAALLLMAKDRLNALAFPARGLSIAFTSLFAAINIRDDQASFDKKADAKTGRAVPSGSGFALAAYPNLVYRADVFRRFFKRLPFATIGWLVLTTIISWDVVICAQTLHKVSVESAAFPSLTVNDTTCKITEIHGSTPHFGLSPPDKGPDDIVTKCETLLAVESGTELPAPGAYAARQSAAALFVGRPSWYHPVGLVVRLLDPTPKRRMMGPLGDEAIPPYLCGYITSCQYDADVADFAESVVNVFSNNILPMLFGVLGTLAGLMRSITAKVRESTLNPRDHRLSWSLMPLGAVAGLTVGLILTPNAGTAGVTTIGSLSATALSFLAGFGAEGFFTMLDGLLARIFPPTPPSGPGPAK